MAALEDAAVLNTILEAVLILVFQSFIPIFIVSPLMQCNVQCLCHTIDTHIFHMSVCEQSSVTERILSALK